MVVVVVVVVAVVVGLVVSVVVVIIVVHRNLSLKVGQNRVSNWLKYLVGGCSSSSCSCCDSQCSPRYFDSREGLVGVTQKLCGSC